MAKRMFATGRRTAVALACRQCGEGAAFLSRGLCLDCRREAPFSPYGTDAQWRCCDCGQQVDATGNGHYRECGVWT
jgi:hypothetical protein